MLKLKASNLVVKIKGHYSHLGNCSSYKRGSDGFLLGNTSGTVTMRVTQQRG